MTARVQFRCRRCDQVIAPGIDAPWCLGGDYRCDTSQVVRVPIEVDPPTVRIVIVPAQQPVRVGPDRSGPGADQSGASADRSGPPPDRGSRPRHDEELLELLAASERGVDGPVESRNDVMRRAGVGAQRADRLFAALLARRTGSNR